MERSCDVFIEQAGNDVFAAVARLLRPFSERVAGRRVLLKPNLHGGLGNTSPQVIAAVIRWARAGGAAEVLLGEGPYYGLMDITAYIEDVGVAQVCRELDVPFVCFHSGKYRIVSPGCAALPSQLGITEWFDWADLVISVPVMKTHFNTLTTLAFKNLKGFIRPQDKRALHSLDLHRAIAALGTVIRPHIHVIDATVAYEGMGPSAGVPVDMGLLLASSDAFAIDVVANWLMGFEPPTVRYLLEAQSLGLGKLPADHEELGALTNVPLADLQRWRRHFERPYQAWENKYPNLRISSERACSGCLMNLFTALRDLEQEGLASALHGWIAIGKAPTGADLVIGNCTFSAWDSTDCVPGCPPLIAEIKAALRRIAKTPQGK
ncbi:MAG: DUF362 domain-containing protein [Armatimonadetes bacterium]|nr:DUF362 domain-containing protein [Armatimonadota bacterium]